MPIFRKGTEEDIKHIAELEAKTFSDAWTETGVRETLGQKQAFITVAEDGGELIGYCIIYYVMDEAEIARIATNEAVRRTGVGRGLLNHTCECCREKQIERLLLDVRESNEGAIAFYTNYGFQIDGIRKGFYEMPKEDAVLMSMSLV